MIGHEFPYTNLHDVNMDWILQVVKEFNEKYHGIDDAIDAAIARLNATADELETAMQEYMQGLEEETTAEVNTAKDNAIAAINQLYSQFQTEANEAIQAIISNKELALSAIDSEMNSKLTQVSTLLNSLPHDYQDALNQMQIINATLNGTNNYPELVQGHYADAQESDSKTLVPDNYRVSSLLSAGCASRKLRTRVTNANGIIRDIIYWTGWGDNAVSHPVPVSTSGADEKTLFTYTFPAEATYFTVVFASDYNMLTAITPSDLQVEFQWIFDSLETLEIEDETDISGNSDGFILSKDGDVLSSYTIGTEKTHMDVGHTTGTIRHYFKDEQARNTIVELKSAIDLTNDGYANIDTNFSHGYISTSSDSVGSVTTSEAYKYQAVTPNLIQFDHNINIKCNSGYEFLLFYYDSQGTYISRSGSWRNADTILSGSYFRVFIRLNPADTSANVPANVFAENIYVDSELSYRIKTVENGLTLEDRKITASNTGNELINTSFAHGRILTTSGHVGEVSISANNYKYQAVTPEAVVFSTPKTIKANPGYVVQIWWYDSNDSYVGRSSNFVSEYSLISNRRYRFFMRLNPEDTSADIPVDVFQDNVCLLSNIGERVEAIEDKPLSTLPDYLLKNMAEKPLGSLSKGYILLSFDDGANTLATGTIPLLIENDVPATFGLLPQSEIFAAGNESELATVIDAVVNHGCVIAMHGSTMWPTYTESALNAYFDSTIAFFADNNLGDTYGAICPGGNGDDTSALVKAVAGGKFDYVFTGNRADKISYDSANADGKYNGARSNRFDLDRRSGIGITTAKVQAIVNYAAENHLLLCPFWHDNTLNDENHPEYIAYFNALITAAKDAGLTFITTKDLPNIT